MAVAKILVGADLSDRSDKAIQRAELLAREHKTASIYGYALDVAPQSRMRGLLEQVAMDETRERASAVTGRPAADIQVRADAGRAHKVLGAMAEAERASLIVLGAHRTDDGPFNLVGSTARRLIDAAPAPVLVVKNPATGPYRNVVIGYDDSTAARQALEFAIELAPHAKRTVVSAFRVPFSDRFNSQSLEAESEAATRAMLADALTRRGAAEDEVIVRAGDAFGLIMDVVRERAPDLLVLGTSMPALYRRVFGGGIVDLIAADPPCDLLVVKV